MRESMHVGPGRHHTHTTPQHKKGNINHIRIAAATATAAAAAAAIAAETDLALCVLPMQPHRGCCCPAQGRPSSPDTHHQIAPAAQGGTCSSKGRGSSNSPAQPD